MDNMQFTEQPGLRVYPKNRNMQLSVIIPTYNRKDKLAKCLRALLAQTYPAEDFEIVVADDGSTDGTEGWVAGFIAGDLERIRYFRQGNKGPAAARNLGVKNARGSIVLFLGDDIIAEPGLVEKHALWHAENPGGNNALLGYVTWARDLRITPFMKWLEHGGPQFAYHELTDGAEADPAKFFYTCNLSLKRDFLLNNGLFDEDFSAAAYEDIELGLRLKKKGLKLRYSEAAMGWHDHATSLKAACRRMRMVGEAGELFRIKAGGGEIDPPEPASLFKKGLRLFRFSIYYPLAVILERTFLNAHVFKYVMAYCRRAGTENFWALRVKKNAPTVKI